MERLSSDAPVPERYRGAVLALGNFDGFHRGHQAVVARAREIAVAERRPLIVATFDPHPVRFFRPGAPPFRLTTLDQRERLFAAAGADAMLVFRFDRTLAGVGAEAFVTDWLVTLACAAIVVTGHDFTFGHNREGTTERLATLGAEHGLRAEAVAPVTDADGPVSSSRIRACLEAGDARRAAALLTRPYAIRGEVAHGDKLGRTIGYPTANLMLGDYLRPAYGIYAVRVTVDDTRYEGAANLGIRPTFDPPKELLEAFLFGFSGDLYGRTIEVELVERLRPEAKFDNVEALAAQMDRDCDAARAVLARAYPA